MNKLIRQPEVLDHSGRGESAVVRLLENLGDLSLRAFDALFPIQEPPLPPPPKPPAPPAAPEPEPDGFLIGCASSNRHPVYALSPQLDRHLLIIGGTGCGKTTLIARLFTEEILKWQ